MRRNSAPQKNVYNAGRSAACQELIYQHMSNHYRRILNAKKVVDTSPPYCFKQKRPSSGHLVPALPSARSCKAKHPFLGRNTSPAATDRSISTNSYSGATGPYPSSRYHVGCIEDLPNPNKKYVIDKQLINTYDKKHETSSYCEDNWTDVKAEENQKRAKTSTLVKKCRCYAIPPRSSKRRLQTKENESVEKIVYSVQEKPLPTDISAKRHNFYASSNLTFTPKILQTNAVSKLRALRVYYPPRKKGKGEKKKSLPVLPMECAPESPNCKCPKICVCESKKNAIGLGKEQIPTSSRDSAYNGGVSSLPESRSPTPDRKTKKDCACNKGNDRFSRQDEQPIVEKPKASNKLERSDRWQCGSKKQTQVSSPPEIHSAHQSVKYDESLKKMKEDDLYTKFIEDITVEILEKCLYTNKALKKVMKKHILVNLHALDKDRMLKEVDNLRIRLGIPEDQSLFDIDNVTTTSSHGDLRSICSVISDSEFVMPDVNGSRNRKPADTDERIWRNLAIVDEEMKATPKTLTSASENEDELVSVIQMDKLNEKIKKSDSSTSHSPVSFGYDKYFSDESELFDKSNESKTKAGKKMKEADLAEEKRKHRSETDSSSEIEENISEEHSVADSKTELNGIDQEEEKFVENEVPKSDRAVDFKSYNKLINKSKELTHSLENENHGRKDK